MGQETCFQQVEQVGLKVWCFVSGRVQKSMVVGSYGN